jgi:NAD(P)-dependent dehydrogenase (short-subunit alcohol dehydrogenase family)
VRAYLKSKQALAQWTLEKAVEWGRATGARVNAIAPGPVLPPPNKTYSEKAGDCLTPRPTPADIAAALQFLLATPSITGQILYVSAGQQLL